VFVLFGLFVLAGCTGLDANKNLIKYGPGERNVPEEIDDINKERQQLQQLIADADRALEAGNFDLAESTYSAILEQDANNLRAREGLRRVASQRQHQEWLAQAEPLAGQSELANARALALLRKILTEDPGNRRAAKLYNTLIAEQAARRLEALKIKLNYDAPVSLEFRDTDLKVIIEALAKGTGINFTLDHEVQSNLRASIFVRNMPLEDALDMLVQSNNLRKKVLSEDSVLIYPDKVTKIRQYQDLVVRSFYLEYADPNIIAGLLRSMLGIKQIETDDRLPTVMIKDVPEVMLLAEKLIASQDLPEPEVMLEMQILEISRTATQDTGFRWPTQLSVLSPNGLTLEALRDTDSSTIGVTPNPAVLFDADESQINLLANPRIRVKDGDSAKIHIGDRVPIITSNVSSTGVISENVQYIDVGLKLNAEPKINLGGDVNIKLSLDVSTLGAATRTDSGSIVFQIGTRNASTQLRLKDGETQVLAGLINDSDRKNISKVPGLGDLPILGRLFSTHGDEKVKTELVLLITPRIIRQPRAPDANLTEYWVGSELQAGRTFTQPRSREEVSELFRPGQAPARSAPEQAPPSGEPEGLNITLPPGLTSEF
jgi:general secretion pathway protein D